MAEANLELQEILYSSELAAGIPANEVGSIIAQARTGNVRRGVTGLLVFDGHRFCQHLEGPRDVVVRLMDRIAMDERHAQVRVMYEGLVPQRRYAGFEVGLADTECDLLGLQQLDGVEALARFLQLRKGFDVS